MVEFSPTLAGQGSDYDNVWQRSTVMTVQLPNVQQLWMSLLSDKAIKSRLPVTVDVTSKNNLTVQWV